MRTVKTVIQDTLTLRPLIEADVTDRYLAWFRDEKVTCYIEAHNLTRQDVINYIHHQKDDEYFMYAIIVAKHIGNLKIGPIQWRHELSDLVTVIGDRDYWGKGCATEAIRQGISIAWGMGLRKLSAGIWSENIGSIKAYTKAGFVVEGILKNHYIDHNGNLQDRVCISIWNPACK